MKFKKTSKYWGPINTPHFSLIYNSPKCCLSITTLFVYVSRYLTLFAYAHSHSIMIFTYHIILLFLILYSIYKAIAITFSEILLITSKINICICISIHTCVCVYVCIDTAQIQRQNRQFLSYYLCHDCCILNYL